MTIELRHLRYFVAVAEELHFGRAAQRVGIAQPALSQQIRRLEDEVGVELFHRTRRKVELSAAGRAMEGRARQALAAVDAAVDAARRAARGEAGHLTVGFIETAATTIVPLAVQRFRTAHPDVGLTLRELGVAEQLERLRAGTLDVAVVRPPVDPTGLELADLHDERLIVAVPDREPVARRRRISPSALAQLPLVLLAREVVPALHDQVVGLLQGHGGARIAQEATSIQAVLGLVAAGLGVAPLPESVRALTRFGVEFVALEPSPRTSMAIAWRQADPSPLIGAFLAAARSAASAG